MSTPDDLAKQAQGPVLTWTVWCLVVLAILLRVGAVAALKSWRFPGTIEHGLIARMLLEGEGFAFIDFGYRGPSSVQSPTYPLLLAGLYWLFGVESAAAHIAAMLINALLGGLSVALTYMLAGALGGARGVALLAAAAVAIWPTQIYAATYAQAIVMITAGLTGMLLMFQKAVSSGRLWPWVMFSVIGALTALTEPVLLPALAFAGVMILLWPTLGWAARLRNGAILLAATLAIIGPWTLRNRMVHGEWIPIKSTFWVNMWKGNNDYATGTDRVAITDEQLAKLRAAQGADGPLAVRGGQLDSLRQYDMLTPEQLQRLHGKPDAEREKVFREWTLQWIAANPGGYARLCLLRLAKSLWVEWDNPQARNLVYIGSRTVLALLSAVGLVLALRARWALTFPLVVYGSALALSALTITAARFWVPFEPMLMCLGAGAVLTAAAPITRRRWAGVPRAGVGGA